MYDSTPAPTDSLESLARHVDQELLRVSAALQSMVTPYVQLAVLYVAPAKPREGLVVFADGTTWNPGSGRGVYVYSGSAWVKL